MAKKMTVAEIVALLDQHVPVLTPKAEAAIDDVMLNPNKWGVFDAADMAVRECWCGHWIDSYSAYIEHLKEVFGEEREEKPDAGTR